MNKKKGFIIDNYQAILFDFDGVLCECMDVKTKAFEDLFKSYGKDIVKKVVKHHIENGGISRYKKIKHYYEEFLKKTITEEKVNEIAKDFSNLVVEKVITSDWVRGAKEFLEKYHKKIDLYIVSGTPQEELNLVVSKRRMVKYFKGVFGTPTIKPIHFKKIISENGYNNKKVLYIGDSLSDYNAARKANIIFLGRMINNSKNYFPRNIPLIKNFKEII